MLGSGRESQKIESQKEYNTKEIEDMDKKLGC